MLQKELDTERLHLRQLRDEDAPGIMAIRSNPEVNKYVGRSNNCALHDAIAFIGKIKNLVVDGGGFYWAITLKGNDEPIGTICYWNLEPAEDKAEIGYELLPDHQGKGYMTEALNAVALFGFKSLNFKLITAFPVSDNLDSVRLLDRTGFVFAGDFIDKETGNKHLDYRLSNPSRIS